jgi:hypothetical protein
MVSQFLFKYNLTPAQAAGLLLLFGGRQDHQ